MILAIAAVSLLLADARCEVACRYEVEGARGGRFLKSEKACACDVLIDYRAILQKKYRRTPEKREIDRGEFVESSETFKFLDP